MHKILLTAFSGLALLAAAPAQSASWNTIGTPCTDPALTMPAVGHNGLPILGQAYDVTYSGPNRATWPTELRPVLLTGLQQTLFPVPPISSSQPVGCDILVLPMLMEIMDPDPLSPIAFQSRRSFQVPNNRILIGMPVYHQWLVVNQTCLVLGCRINAILVSDTGVATIGL